MAEVRSDSGKRDKARTPFVSVVCSLLKVLLRHPAPTVIAWLTLSILAALISTGVWYSYWIEKLKRGSYETATEVFAAPRVIRVGDRLAAADIIRLLQRSGY